MRTTKVRVHGATKKISPECEAELKKMAQRMIVEVEQAKTTLLEKIERELNQEWVDLKHLDRNKPEHKVASIMLERLFKKLNRLGLNWR